MFFLESAVALKKELLDLEIHNQAVFRHEMFRSDVDLQCRLMTLLLNSEVRHFRFPPRLRDTQNSTAPEMWRALVAQQPPKLTSITHDSLGYKSRNSQWDVSPFVRDMLPAFPSLVELRLKRFVCDDATLSIIAEHLPHLRYNLHFFFARTQINFLPFFTTK